MDRTLSALLFILIYNIHPKQQQQKCLIWCSVNGLTGNWMLFAIGFVPKTKDKPPLFLLCFMLLMNAPTVLLSTWFSKTNRVRKTKVTWHNKGFESARKGLAAPAHTSTLCAQLIPVDAWVNGWLIRQFKSPVPSQTHTKDLFWVPKKAEREKVGHWEKRKREEIQTTKKTKVGVGV